MLLTGVVAQQDAQYSQYMFNHLSINPAYAGTREMLDASLIVRKQWRNIEGSPDTRMLVFQGPLGKKKAGIGFEMGSENIGPKSIGTVKLSYSYRIKLGPGKLSFGLRSGLDFYKYDWAKIKYRDLNDPYANPNQDRWTVLSIDFGMYYYTKSFYVGAAATHLNQDRLYNVIDSLNNGTYVPHIFLPCGIGFQAGENLIVNPSFLVKYVEGAPLDVDVNVNFLLDQKLWLGVGYRLNTSAGLLAMWNINDHMRLGYSFDYGLNRIGTLGGGSHEIIFGYGFNLFKTKTLTPRYL
jgi:type IX secretion system PorP/SprF family membrane protein